MPACRTLMMAKCCQVWAVLAWTDEPLFFTLGSERKLMTHCVAKLVFLFCLLTDKVFPGRRGFLCPAFFRECLAGLDIPSGFPGIYGHNPVSSYKKLFAHHFFFPSRLVSLLLVAVAVR